MLTFSSEVQAALLHGIPIVGLESTLISHGLPYPKNLELALACEEDIKSKGCVPATIAIIKGKIHVGLSEDQLSFLATDKSIHKLNASDIALCAGMEKSGATTVAGTMFCLHLAGIRFFATGGMGGVHRDAIKSFDISQDIGIFKTCPVAMISSGAKSILDLPKTMEMLETLAIPVVGFGTSELPAFWSRSSGLNLAWHVETASDAAHLAQKHWQLNPQCGLIIANPVPPSHDIPLPRIEAALITALKDADRLHMQGKMVTPYLLQRIRDLVPESMETNIALIRSNAATAAEIAYAYHKG